jgi:MtrB/PioB family decaheme-associated outer membrane protein
VTRRRHPTGHWLTILAGALGLLLGAASPGFADTDVGGLTLSGEAEVGGRTVMGDFGSAKYGEYREHRPGLLGGGWFLAEDKDGRYYVRGQADFQGEWDQHYELEGGRYGWFRAEAQYDQYPHLFSDNVHTRHLEMGGSFLWLPDGLQNAVLLGGSPALQREMDAATPTDLEFMLRTGEIRLAVRPFEAVDLKAGYRWLERKGTRPLSLGFGTPGVNFASVAAPINERIHELKGEIGLNFEDANLQLEYTGSFFENDLQAVTVDNPLGGAGVSPGRATLAPDNSSNTLSLTGAVTLPVDFPARIVGTVAYGHHRQNEEFLPHTIAPFMSPVLALPQGSLHGEVRTWLGNVVFTARPVDDLSLTGRYRIYDYDNTTPVIAFPGHVLSDSTVVTETRFSVPSDYRKQNASLDASYRIHRRATVKASYAWENWQRSRDREVTRLDEHTGKVAFDLRPADWAVLRTSYEFGIRRGSDYRTFAHLERTVLPEEIEELWPQSQFRELRKFDQADRVRHEANALIQLTPGDDLTLAFTGNLVDIDYDNTVFGLRGEHRWSVGADAEYTPTARVNLFAHYTYENIESKQRSRWRPRRFFLPAMTVVDNPLNDWSSTSEDRIHTLGGGAQINLIEDRLELDVSYELQSATAYTRAGGPAGFVPSVLPTTSGDGGFAQDFPVIRDRLQILEATLSYHVKKDVFTLKGLYGFERLDLTNFKVDNLQPFMPDSNVDGSGVVIGSSDIFLGDDVDDYHAHILALTAIYHF